MSRLSRLGHDLPKNDATNANPLSKHFELARRGFYENSHMRRVFYNIIDNACDAMPEGGTLDVRVARSGPWVTVTITDSGIGMDARQLARFGQAGWTTKSDGHGVGVVSALRLIREAGGDMHVTSSAGQGTQVIVNGPVSHYELE